MRVSLLITDVKDSEFVLSRCKVYVFCHCEWRHVSKLKDATLLQICHVFKFLIGQVGLLRLLLGRKIFALFLLAEMIVRKVESCICLDDFRTSWQVELVNINWTAFSAVIGVLKA